MIGPNDDPEEALEALLEDLRTDGETESVDVEAAIDADLPIDQGLEVILNPVPGDAWRETHCHEGSDGAFTMHLKPGDAQDFDRYVIQYLMDLAESEV